MPPPPEHLKGEALAEWHRTTTLMAEVGLITKLDRGMLACYCVAWARWVECEKQVADIGMILRTSTGVMIYSPYLTAANRAMEQVRQFGEQLGLSGSARSRIRAGTPLGGDAAEAFLNGRA